MDNVLEIACAILETTPVRWSSLTRSLPTELLTMPPAPGEWSAMECLGHLLDTERWVFPVRVKAFLAGQDFPAYHPDAQGSKPDQAQTPTDLAAEFARYRDESLALLKTLKPDDLVRTARHGELGIVSLGEMVHEWAGHDLMHTVQAERALMQPFIQGCGPWLTYFQDHVVQSSSQQK